tara:strand:+ start:1744 stop:2697 length:954 start_codon:yes stop_codon:yes gene_type:complete
MIEKTENQETQEEQIEVNIQDDSVVEANADSKVASSDEELENYTKGVSKRINKKNAQIKAAEERAAHFEQIVRQQQEQLSTLTKNQQAQQATVLQKEEEALEVKEREAADLYKRAVEAGDADLMSKADDLKGDLRIQKEKIAVAKRKAEQNQTQEVQQVDPATYQEQPQQPQQQVQPTKEALNWYENNKWYGDQDDPTSMEATQFAFFQHNMLVNEGYEPDSDEYYGELNNRIYKVYPQLQSASETDDQKDNRPSVQRVASASVGSRQQTRSKKNGVTFSKSEVERLRGLKPHNMSESDWLKRVAQEKQKIAQREAM